jgi:hypothetical protein
LTYKPGALHPVASTPFKALTCFDYPGIDELKILPKLVAKIFKCDYQILLTYLCGYDYLNIFQNYTFISIFKEVQHEAKILNIEG